MADRKNDRLVHLKNGMWIDPTHILLLHYVVNAKPYIDGKGQSHGASVIIETKHQQIRMPAKDFKDARQYVDTLAALCNFRGHKVVPDKKIDWTGYEDERPAAVHEAQ